MFEELVSTLRTNLKNLIGDDEQNLKVLEQKVLSSLPDDLKDNLEYVQNVILQAVKFIQSATDELTLPMINLGFSKDDALPRFLWGMLWDDWKKNPEDGTSVFLQDYRDRGQHNRKKKAYFSALTPDLYDDNYQPKVASFFDQLLGWDNIDTPLMKHYEQGYLNLYWDLHLNVKPQDIPEYTKEVGINFINCLAIEAPFDPDNLQQSLEFKRSYEYVRQNRPLLAEWVEGLVNKMQQSPESYSDTFVYYWFADSGEGEGGFTPEDITFECFHNYLALSQWGNTIYNMMDLLREDNDNSQARKIQDEFKALMNGNPDAKTSPGDDSDFTQLDFFTFELLRVILPNNGSFSRVG